MKDSQPLVSIGMPLYNEELYIREALDSLLAQDYDNFELIISDNASEDATPQICAEYAAKEPRIKYSRNETNLGAMANFGKVFATCKGEYFFWTSGHDLRHPTFLSRCVEVLMQDESVILCYPDAVWIDSEGNPIGEMLSLIDTRGLNAISRFQLVLWGLGYGAPIYGVMRSHVLRQHTIGSSVPVIGPDNIFLADLSFYGSFARIPEPLFYVRKISDFGSWEAYIQKIFNQPASGLSAYALFWQMIEVYLQVVAKHIHPSLERNAAILAVVTCLLTKYRWILTGLQSSNIQSCDLDYNFGERLNQLVAHVHDSAITIEKTFSEIAIEKTFLKKCKSPEQLTPQIAVDGVFFQVSKTGIARVWSSLLEEWAKNGFAKHIVVLDRAGTAPKIPGIRYRLVPAYDYSSTDADREILQQVCDEEGADLFISSYYTTPLSTPSVFMVHDMIPELMGWDLNHPMWREKHYGIQHATAYIAVSENTARDFVRFFPHISLESVIVAQNGVNHKTFSPATTENINQFKTKYGISKPYFIVVGTGGYKNTILFFQAFAQLYSRQGFEIVCTGSSSLLAVEIKNYTLGSVVHMLQLTDEELRAAYSGAVALVYPSKYEGFGLPVLEAITCGCPVITCPNASIPEVVGEAALYVNDNDVDGLANALCDVQKSDIRNSLIAAGLEQAKKFSWSKMTKTVSSALIDATLLGLNLKDINLIVFPAWFQPEESLCFDLFQIIKAIATHPDSSQMTLLVDNGNIPDEEAALILSTVSMNLLLQEDLDVSEGPEISLVGQLGEIQWEALLPRIHARIVLENEDQQAIAQVKAETIPSYKLDSFISQGGSVLDLLLD